MKKFLLLFSILFFFSCSKDSITYNLTISANPENGGTVSSLTQQYSDGTTATVTASPNNEFILESWSGAKGNLNSVDILMNSDKTVIANFIKKKYVLIVNIVGNGSVSKKTIKQGLATDYTRGSIVELTALPKDGWLFQEWKGDLFGTENPKQITFDKEKKITAVFVKNIDLKNISTFLALGDSYTIGESVETKERWPVLLMKELKTRTNTISSLNIIARTGWKVEQLNEEIKNLNLTPPFGLVSLQIGVNNQFQGQDASDFRPMFTELLNRSLSLAGSKNKKLFVLSIPDWGASGYESSQEVDQISKEIDEFNSVIKSEAEKKGIPYFDITLISRRARSDKTLIASDGLHPSGKMYELWVEKIVSEISKIDLN